MFGLPDGVAACLFDMDGVVTRTASALFDVRVDGLVARERGLRGKPAPDTFLAAAEALKVSAKQAVVFEDALAGVAAGRAGGFALVVGVDRVGQAQELREHGADIVQDVAELLREDGHSDEERYSKPASERRPSGPARAVGAGDAVRNRSGFFE
jgi:beta-phosphoglucomutase-like phosphatase (HAD superfamily)